MRMRRNIVFFFFALVLLGAGCQQKQKAETPAATQGSLDTRQEISMLQDVVRKDPGNLKARIDLGNDLMDSQRYDEAIAAYRKALDIDTRDVDVRVDMGTCYRRIGKPDTAVNEFRKALEINPNHQMALRNLGIVLEYDMKDKKGAIQAFERYLKTAPNAREARQAEREVAKMKAEK